MQRRLILTLIILSLPLVFLLSLETVESGQYIGSENVDLCNDISGQTCTIDSTYVHLSNKLLYYDVSLDEQGSYSCYNLPDLPKCVEDDEQVAVSETRNCLNHQGEMDVPTSHPVRIQCVINHEELSDEINMDEEYVTMFRNMYRDHNIFDADNIYTYESCFYYSRSIWGTNPQQIAGTLTLRRFRCRNSDPFVNVFTHSDNVGLEVQYSSSAVGAVASWDKESSAPQEYHDIDDGSSTEYYHHRGQDEPPFAGMAFMQPPECPVVVNRMPGYDEGGSDYCLCDGKAIRTNKKVLCLENSKFYCEGNNCGSDSIGGLWLWEYEGSGSSRHYFKSEEHSKPEISATNQYLLDAKYKIVGGTSHHQAYAAQQAFSTWMYVDEKKENIALQLEQINSGDYTYVEVKKLVAVHPSWIFEDVLSFPEGSYSPTNFYDRKEGSGETQFDSRLAIIGELDEGWYFIKVFHTRRSRSQGNERGIQISLVNEYSEEPIDTFKIFDIVNQYGPMTFSNVNESQDACKNDPYNSVSLSGRWSDKGGCCGSALVNNFGKSDDSGKVCLLDVGWSEEDYYYCSNPETDLPMNNTELLPATGQCCGDDLDEGTSITNEGLISEYGEYLCVNITKNFNGSTVNSMKEDLNSDFRWVEASEYNYNILRGDSSEDFITNFISHSSNNEWFQCDASNEDLFGNLEDLRLAEKKFLDTTFEANNTCSAILSTGFGNVDFKDCQADNTAVCRHRHSSDNGFCWYVTDGNVRSYTQDHFDQNIFDNSCGKNCYIKSDNGFVQVRDHNNYQDAISDWQDDASFISRSDTGIIPSFCWNDFAFNHPDCEGEDIDSDDLLECNSEYQYCSSGRTVIDSQDNVYCVSENGDGAQCGDIPDGGIPSCSATGGKPFNDGNDVCSGVSKGEGSNACCYGEIIHGVAQDSDFGNESYICYARNDGELIKECGGYRSNFNNHLNEFQNLFPTGISAWDGEALQSLYYSGGITYLNLDSGAEEGSNLFWQFSFKNWSSFDYLVFNYQQDIEGNVTFLIDDDDLEFNPFEYSVNNRGPSRALTIMIPIEELDKKDIDWSSSKTFDFKNNENYIIRVLADNFYLSGGEDDNTDGFFCSYQWNKWVDNLDGPSDSGFDEDASYTDYGPYQFACNAQPSFAWTGTKCCGDDTNSTNTGEYFVDREGACWRGVPFLNDETLYHSGREAFNESLSKRLLFKDDAVYLCGEGSKREDIRKEHLDDQKFSYDGVTDNGDTSFSDYVENDNLFTVRGSWICQDSGWVNIHNVNSVHMLAASMLQLREDDGDYSLNCGPTSSLANYIPWGQPGGDAFDRNNVCVLRKISDNTVRDEVYVAVHIPEGFDEYWNNALDHVPAFENDKPSDSEQSSSQNHFYSIYGTSGDYHFYYNEDFNYLIISPKSLVPLSDGFIQTTTLNNLWNTLRKFILGLFGADKSSSSVSLEGLDVLYSLSIYDVSDLSIYGYIQRSGGVTSVNIEYTNLSESIELLKELYDQEGLLEYYTINNVQGFVYDDSWDSTTRDGRSLANAINWNALTSGLRLNPDAGSPENFNTVCPPRTELNESSGKCEVVECLEGEVLVNGRCEYLDCHEVVESTVIEKPNVSVDGETKMICDDDVSINQYCVEEGYDRGVPSTPHSGGACYIWVDGKWVNASRTHIGATCYKKVWQTGEGQEEKYKELC